MMHSEGISYQIFTESRFSLEEPTYLRRYLGSEPLRILSSTLLEQHFNHFAISHELIIEFHNDFYKMYNDPNS